MAWRQKKFEAWKPNTFCKCEHPEWTHRDFKACRAEGCGCQVYDPPKRTKYGNKKELIGGDQYDSKFEGKVSADLKYQNLAGEFKEVRRQVEIPLYVHGTKVAIYKADFIVTHKDGTEEIVEAKGFLTPESKLKWALLNAIYDEEHPEVKRTMVFQSGFNRRRRR